MRFSGLLIGLTLATLCCASGQGGLALFHKMQAALGGADKIAAIHDFEEQVHAQVFDTEGKLLAEVDKRTRWIRPNYLRIDQIGPWDTYALYFDGTKGWEILPDKSVKDLAGSELKFAQDYQRNFDLNMYLADRDPGCRITSPEPNAVHIVCGDDSSSAMDIFLDPVSGLPLSNGALITPDVAQYPTKGTLFQGWTVVRGVKLSSRREHFSKDRRAEMNDDFIVVNSGLKVADLAVRPADLKPVLRK